MSRYKKQNIRFETNVCLRQADKYISIPRRRFGNGHKFSLWFLYISVWKYINLFKEGEVITIMWRVFITNDIRSFYPKQNNNTYMCMSQHASITCLYHHHIAMTSKTWLQALHYTETYAPRWQEILAWSVKGFSWHKGLCTCILVFHHKPRIAWWNIYKANYL